MIRALAYVSAVVVLCIAAALIVSAVYHGLHSAGQKINTAIAQAEQ